MAAIIITPIKASFHWDDAKQRWDFKASRQTKENGKFKEWEDLLDKTLTLAELLIILYQFWGMGSGSGVQAAMGDIQSLGVAMAAGNYNALESIPELPADHLNFDGTILDGTEYVGATAYNVLVPGTNWGNTPAPP